MKYSDYIKTKGDPVKLKGWDIDEDGELFHYFGFIGKKPVHLEKWPYGFSDLTLIGDTYQSI